MDKILLVENGTHDRDNEELLSVMRARGHVVRVRGLRGLERELSEGVCDAVVSEWDLGADDGAGVCREVNHEQPGVPVIIVSRQANMDCAIRALRAGAYDFLAKPVERPVFEVALSRAIHEKNVREELELIESSSKRCCSHGLIGQCDAMKKVYSLIERVADTPSSVVVTGESGTGKELVAQALHRCSSRRDGPFVALNCSSIPATLLESEIFGHEKGAFTDAKRSRDGLFVQAHRGTLFMDEIAEMPQEMQPKLLRLLQDQSVRPLGGSKEIETDVRLIAATHDDLEQDVVLGKFRQDLYYRLNVIQIHLPPLRKRGNDVLHLAKAFVEKSAERIGRPVDAISPEAADCLARFEWPGNVRQLQNCMERAVTLAKFRTITPADLPERVVQRRSSEGDESSLADLGQVKPLEEVERRYIERVVRLADNNKSHAAKLLRMSRRTLYRKLRSYGEHRLSA